MNRERREGRVKGRGEEKGRRFGSWTGRGAEREK